MQALRNAYTVLLVVVVTGLYSAWGFTHATKGALTVDTKTLSALAAGMLFACIRLGKFARHVSTFVHELGHCVGAVMVGAFARSIKYQPDSSGVAVLGFGERIGRVRRVIVLLSGYAAPSVLAGALTAGVLLQYSLEVLLGLTAMAIGALTLLVRNAWGIYVTAFISLVTGTGAYYLDESFAEWALLLAAGVLFARGVIDSVEQYGLKVFADCDAELISKLLYRIPRKVVAGIQILFNVSSLLIVSLILASGL